MPMCVPCRSPLFLRAHRLQLFSTFFFQFDSPLPPPPPPPTLFQQLPRRQTGRRRHVWLRLGGRRQGNGGHGELKKEKANSKGRGEQIARLSLCCELALQLRVEELAFFLLFHPPLLPLPHSLPLSLPLSLSLSLSPSSKTKTPHSLSGRHQEDEAPPLRDQERKR